MPIKIIQGNFSATVKRLNDQEAPVSVTVKKGQPFDFTDGEIADIERAHGEDALRDPVDEGAVAAKPATSKPATAKGNKPKAGDGKGDESL